MDKGNNKITGIRQIVKFKGFLKKWKKTTFGHKVGNNNIKSSGSTSPRPEVSSRLIKLDVHGGLDEDNGMSLELPNDVPRGYLGVYVGQEQQRRFIIPTTYLSDPLFKVLLEKVEEEFGFDQRGVLAIPCDIETFKYLLQCMENHIKEKADETKTA